MVANSNNMKKALLGLVIFLAAPFSVHATTVYQQLSDSSSYFSPSGATIQIASFIPTSSGTFGPDSFLFFVGMIPTPDTGAQFNFYISTTTSTAQGIASFALNPDADSGADQFLEAPVVGGGGGTYEAGTTYYVLFALSGANAPGSQVRTNLSNDFFYGYIVDDGGETIPIAPGIPGFTDVGIATTTQQAYCSTNFATSSGLLDSLGRSISLGFCNVGVFLFVPSSQAMSQWQTLASTSQQKIPFSYFAGFRTLFQQLTATTSSVVPTYAADLHATGIGSTTPIGNTLPSLTWLSVAAIQTYLPTGIHDALFFLARSAIWLSIALMFYRRIIPKHAKV